MTFNPIGVPQQPVNAPATTRGQVVSSPSKVNSIVFRSAKATAESQRGNKTLVAAKLEFLRVGDFVRLQMTDEPSQSLARYLYQEDPGPLENLHSRASVTWTAAIVSVDNDTQTLTLDRPLTTDVRLEWQPSTSLPARHIRWSRTTWHPR